MTTNDPLNPYPGNLKRHEVIREGLSENSFRMRSRFDSASDRDPLLSDEVINATKPLVSTIDLKTGDFSQVDMPMNQYEVRDFYERLIDEGRLRVVEEVDLVEWNELDSMKYCSNCGHYGMDDSLLRFDFCPGCGNPIKR